jgi:hypothetical protein
MKVEWVKRTELGVTRSSRQVFDGVYIKAEKHLTSKWQVKITITERVARDSGIRVGDHVDVDIAESKEGFCGIIIQAAKHGKYRTSCAKPKTNQGRYLTQSIKLTPKDPAMLKKLLLDEEPSGYEAHLNDVSAGRIEVICIKEKSQ